MSRGHMQSPDELQLCSKGKSPRIVAIVHIFYPDIWTDLRDCLLNISEPFDLYVTATEKDKEIFNDVVRSFPDAKTAVVENKGYDVGPFLYILNKINLEKYDFLLKLHTKRDVPVYYTLKGRWAGGSLFREESLEFCSSAERWKASLQCMEDPSVGMVGSPLCILGKRFDYTSNYAPIYQVMQKIGFAWDGSGQYVAGTMFLARASLFKILQGKFNLEDFETPDRAKGDGLPHALERAMGYMVYTQGATVAAWDGTNTARQTLLWKIKSFFFEVRYSKRRRIIRVLHIPVFYLPLPEIKNEYK